MGQKGSLSYVWAPIGSRPPMIRDNRHDTAYLFGAICPARGVGAAMITPAANTECMNLQLAEISLQVATGSVAVVISGCRLASAWRGHQATEQHRAVVVAALRSRTEFNGEHRERLASQQTLRMRVGQLRRHFASFRRRMELVRRRPTPDPVNRRKNLGNGQCPARLVLDQRSRVRQIADPVTSTGCLPVRAVSAPTAWSINS